VLAGLHSIYSKQVKGRALSCCGLLLVGRAPGLLLSRRSSLLGLHRWWGCASLNTSTELCDRVRHFDKVSYAAPFLLPA
jgi:hypothetical protein